MEIENLSLEELVVLHAKVCQRIKKLQRAKVFEQLQDFEIGDEVRFKHEGSMVTGRVIRVNRKSLSVKTKEGSWYVDPRCATKISLAFQRE